MNKKSESILARLYHEYYHGNSQSSVTSSHWRTVGWHQVKKTPNGFDLSGGGFGSRRSDNLINQLLRWPSTKMTGSMLRKNNCSMELVSLGKDIARRQHRLFDFDCARQVLTLNLLASKLPEFSMEGRNSFDGSIAIIGDGYGFLGGLLGEWLPQATIIEINLGRTLFFDAYYLLKAFPRRSHALYKDMKGVAGKFAYLAAESVSEIQSLDAWLYINLSSMQEMDITVVRDYFRLMRAGKDATPYFYCANREEKILPNGEVIRFEDYGWLPEDEVMIDELCPWLQAYPKSFPPKWLPFDGPGRHRLVKLSLAD